MKKLLSLLSGVLLVSAAAFCALGAVISAFSLEVDMRSLLYVILAAAVVAVALVTFFKTIGVLIYLVPAAVFLYWVWSEALIGARGALFRLTSELNVWLPVPVLFEGAIAAPRELLLFFAAVGALLIAPLVIAVCRRRSAIFTILLTLPIVALSLLIESYPPIVWYLIGIFAVYVTMALSTALQPADVQRRAIAVLPALALSLALCGGAYLVAQLEPPPRDEVIGALEERITLAVSNISPSARFTGYGWPRLDGSAWRMDESRVSVADAGRRDLTGEVLFEVTVDKFGIYYLRGYSLSRFNGRTWVSGTIESFYEQDESPFEMARFNIEKYNELYSDNAISETTLTVTRRGDDSDLMYMPYYSVANAGAEYEYTVAFFDVGERLFTYAEYVSDALQDTVLYYPAYTQQRESVYKTIDETTAEALRFIAQTAGIDMYGERVKIAAQVAEYISSAAEYTLTPQVTPDNEDFALYFLRESKQGYCIHFATAATLMLRALDVPARFVCGFVATVPHDGATATLTDEHAHAWVEVYYSDVGWVPLEVTPGGGHTSAQRDFLPDITPTPNIDDDYIEAGLVTPPPTTPPPGGAPTPRPTTPPPSGNTENGELGGAEADGAENNLVPRIIIFAAICLIIIAVLLLPRRIITLRIRARLFQHPNTNTAVIHAWRYILRLYAVGSPQKEIEAIALKARFSSYTLSEQERDIVVAFAKRHAAAVYNTKSDFQRIIMRYIWCLY